MLKLRSWFVMTGGILPLLMASALPCLAQDSRSKVVLVRSQKKAYERACAALSARLDKQGITLEEIIIPAEQPGAAELTAQVLAKNPTCIALTGSKFANELRATLPQVPIVVFMETNVADSALVDGARVSQPLTTVIAAHPSPADQLRWVRETMPSLQKLDVLYSAKSTRTAEELQSVAESMQIDIKLIEANRDQFPDAVEALKNNHADGVMMILDSSVYNGASIKRLLIYGIRNKKAIWTFSSKIVKAGAFSGLYSDPQDVGKYTADVIIRLSRGQVNIGSGIEYPRKPVRALNHRTAKLIGVKVGSSTAKQVQENFGEK